MPRSGRDFLSLCDAILILEIETMSGSARLSVATLGCLRAVRSFLINDGLWTARSSFQQTRGKKYDVRQPRTVKVKLLRDIETYGAQGDFVPKGFEISI